MKSFVLCKVFVKERFSELSVRLKYFGAKDITEDILYLVVFSFFSLLDTYILIKSVFSTENIMLCHKESFGGLESLQNLLTIILDISKPHQPKYLAEGTQRKMLYL